MDFGKGLLLLFVCFRLTLWLLLSILPVRDSHTLSFHLQAVIISTTLSSSSNKVNLSILPWQSLLLFISHLRPEHSLLPPTLSFMEHFPSHLLVLWAAWESHFSHLHHHKPLISSLLLSASSKVCSTQFSPSTYSPNCAPSLILPSTSSRPEQPFPPTNLFIHGIFPRPLLGVAGCSGNPGFPDLLSTFNTRH